jgi:hypothetical protein
VGDVHVLSVRFLAQRPSGSTSGAQERARWRVLAYHSSAAGVNELLDAQTLLTLVGRAHAEANGWYG